MTDSDAVDAGGGIGARIEGLFGSDLLTIVATFAVMYAVYVVLGVVSGLPAQGILATLVQITLLIAFYAMLTLALNLHWGYTGLFNIGIVGFMAVGAYTTLILVNPAPEAQTAGAVVGGFGLPFTVGIVAAVVASALVGLVVALPALRLRADYLAITTIAFAEIIRFIFQSGSFSEFTAFGRTVGTGGGAGLLINFEDPISRYVLSSGWFEGFVGWVESTAQIGANLAPVLETGAIAAILMGVVVAYYWLFKRTGESPFGRVLKAIDEDEDVARALGKDTNRFKIYSFMLGCALMGLAGAFYAIYFLGSVNPVAFRPQLTFFVWVALIIGGAGSNTGSVLGAAIFVGVLLRGPLYLKNVIESFVEVGSAPATIIDAIAALATLDVTPIVAYTLENISLFRIIALGVVLVWLMKRRPDGLFGHRKETAAAIPLAGRPGGNATAEDRATGGGEDA
jgi:branched-chain amino acid transport system permease protein